MRAQYKQKARNPRARAFLKKTVKSGKLLDLGFLELDMLLSNRVVLGLRHLVRHRTAVLRRDVEETSVGRRQKLDLDSGSLGHGRPAFKKMKAVESRIGSTANSGAKLRI